jgi:PHD/YefM family antitoxin component YafN of YafNO toxin-antitoxin module
MDTTVSDDPVINIETIQKELLTMLEGIKNNQQRVLINKAGQPVAAIVPIEDYQYLEEKEEQWAQRAVDEAMKEQGDDPYIPWEQVKKELDS